MRASQARVTFAAGRNEENANVGSGSSFEKEHERPMPVEERMNDQRGCKAVA